MLCCTCVLSHMGSHRHTSPHFRGGHSCDSNIPTGSATPGSISKTPTPSSTDIEMLNWYVVLWGENKSKLLKSNLDLGYIFYSCTTLKFVFQTKLDIPILMYELCALGTYAATCVCDQVKLIFLAPYWASCREKLQVSGFWKMAQLTKSTQYTDTIWPIHFSRWLIITSPN